MLMIAMVVSKKIGAGELRYQICMLIQHQVSMTGLLSICGSMVNPNWELMICFWPCLGLGIDTCCLVDILPYDCIIRFQLLNQKLHIPFRLLVGYRLVHTTTCKLSFDVVDFIFYLFRKSELLRALLRLDKESIIEVKRKLTAGL